MANEMKILITGDASHAMGVMSAFSQTVKGATGEVEGHFSRLSGVVEGLAAPILKITALVGGGALFKGGIDGAVGLSKEVNGLTRLMGGTSKEAAVTRVAVNSIFGDTEGYEAAATKMVKTLNKNEAAITSMGIKTRDAQGHFRDMNTLLPEVVQGLNQYAAGTDRDAAAQAIFGRSFKDVLIYAQMTPAVMEEARKKTQEYGLEMDAQARGTIKAYRKSTVDLDEAWLGLKTRVALQVMPTLTALGNYLGSEAPAAINAAGAGMKVLGDLAGNTAVQVGLASTALYSLLPVLGALLVRIPLVSMAMGTFRVQMALAAREGVAGFAAISGAARGTVAVLLNPYVLAAAAILGTAGVMSHAAQSYSKDSADMAEAALKAAQATAENTRKFEDQGQSLSGLEAKLRSTAAGSREHKSAAAELHSTLRAMTEVYPDFLAYLHKENGQYTDLAGSVERFSKAKVRELEMRLAGEKDAAQWAAEDKADALGKHNIVSYALVYKGVAENAEREQKAHEETAKAIQNQINALKGLKEDGGNKHWAGGEGKEKEDPFQTDMLRLQKQGLEYAEKTTLEEQRLAEVRKLDLQREEDLQKIQADLDKKGSTLTSDEATKLRLQVEENYAHGRMAVWDKFAKQRKDMEAELQGKLTAAEEGGLEKRLEAIRASFVKIREENLKLGRDGKAQYTAEQIQAAQDAAEAQAKKDQIQADLSKLKKELSELAQISGGKLSEQDTQEVLNRWKAKPGTKADAAELYAKESHIGESGTQGAKAGVDAFVAQQENAFTKWKGFTTTLLSGATSAFSGFFSSILQHGQTASQKWDALWKGLSGSVVKASSDMVAQEAVHWAAQKARAAWSTVASAKEEAELTALMQTKIVTEAGKTAAGATGAAAEVAHNAIVVASDTATSTAQIGLAETTMAAKIYAWYATLGPWAIPAAVVTIAAVLAAIGSIAGREKGGDVQAGTPYIVGEAGHELFVPNVSGTIVPHNVLAGASRNLSANLGAHESQVNRLQAQAGSYGPQALAQGGGPAGAYHDYRGSTIITTDSREWAEMVQKGVKTWGRDV
jgi:hypothetical protein